MILKHGGKVSAFSYKQSRDSIHGNTFAILPLIRHWQIFIQQLLSSQKEETFQSGEWRLNMNWKLTHTTWKLISATFQNLVSWQMRLEKRQLLLFFVSMLRALSSTIETHRDSWRFERRWLFQISMGTDRIFSDLAAWNLLARMHLCTNSKNQWLDN